MKIVITSANTAFGMQLAEALLSLAPGDVVLADPEPHRVPRHLRGRTEVRHGSLTEPFSLPSAFDGADSLLLMGGPAAAGGSEDVAAAVEAARFAGVGRIVLLSSIDPRPANPAPWAQADRAAEAIVRSSGLGWSVLRLQESLEDFIAGGVRQQPGGRMFDNRETGRSAPIALSDAAAAAAAVLAGAGHGGRIHELTGPALVGSADLARALGVTYHAHKDFKYLEQLRTDGLSPVQAEALVQLGRAVRMGYYAVATGDVARLAGRPPAGLDEGLAALKGQSASKPGHRPPPHPEAPHCEQRA